MHKPDNVTAKGSDKKFTPHPEGQFIAQCVDVIALGEKVDDYPGTPPKLSTKCALVFRTGQKNADTGECIDIAKEYTVSMGEKANLRKDLESWRGKPYTEAQANEGVPVDKLVGQWGIVTVAQKQSGKGRTYAFLQSIVAPTLVKERPEYEKYERADYWKDRKEEYAKAAATFRAQHAAPSGDMDDDGGFPAASDDDLDSLPF